MERSSLSWQNTKVRYHNPVSKIRSLLKNLDSELMDLCSQCTTAKTHSTQNAKTNNNNNNNNRNKECISPTSLLTTAQDCSGGVQVRTLSSIYRAKVIDAYRNRRIFTVYGNYHTIRRALLRRGWLEKLAPGRYPRLQNLPEEVLLQHAKKGNDFEAMAISKIINHFPAFFIWQPKGFRDTSVDVLPYRNRVRRGWPLDFSTKIGLIGCAEVEHWYEHEELSGMSYPRFYRLGGDSEDRMAFIQDFRRTQCRSLLRFVIEHIAEPDELIDEEVGSVQPSIIMFALQQVRRQLNDWDHSTLDMAETNETNNGGETTNDHANDTASVEWPQFLASSTQVVQRKARFRIGCQEMQEFAKMARVLLDKLEERRPDYKWDGCRNLWILKPGYSCRGIGIIIRSSLDVMLQWATTNKNRKYIVQKYIERPLLIYKTKFDIRQYMLLTISESTVSIWLYKDCYLRFSSQEFTIDDLRESIHLTNNSVQKRYKNKNTRDARLPKNNMWSMEQFQVFLKHQNAPEGTWTNRIYAGFRKNLIAVVLASLEETQFVENAFELYGCDFMLDEQYNPILIEINSTPDMSASTDVTARICPMALKDLVKVIVDLPRNSRAPTGLFEMIFQVNYKNKPTYDPQVGLDVCGKAMTIHKPAKSTFRTRFFKKLSTKMTRTKPEPGNKLHTKKSRSVPNAEKPQETVFEIEENKADPVGRKFLKAFTKEALALRYTRPK